MQKLEKSDDLIDNLNRKLVESSEKITGLEGQCAKSKYMIYLKELENARLDVSSCFDFIILQLHLKCWMICSILIFSLLRNHDYQIIFYIFFSYGKILNYQALDRSSINRP